jgi:nucleotide-binding universal stress UspA family protein
MKEINSILFPTDFSAVANSMLPLAVRLAARFDATIHALHIASGGDPHVTETSRYEFPKPPADAPPVKIRESIIPKEGEPAEMIMTAAAAQRCDVIMMASHGRSDVAQFFLGRSVAERVARDSPTPTIVARLFGARRTTRPMDRLSRVMFATDLTDLSKAILPITASIARKAEAEIETMIVFGEGDVRPSPDRKKEILEGFFAEAGASGLLGLIESARGGVGEALVEEATTKQTDLIAFTTALCSGGDPRHRDTAEFIIRNAPCPVLCVNPWK